MGVRSDGSVNPNGCLVVLAFVAVLFVLGGLWLSSLGPISPEPRESSTSAAGLVTLTPETPVLRMAWKDQRIDGFGDFSVSISAQNTTPEPEFELRGVDGVIWGSVDKVDVDLPDAWVGGPEAEVDLVLLNAVAVGAIDVVWKATFSIDVVEDLPDLDIDVAAVSGEAAASWLVMPSTLDPIAHRVRVTAPSADAGAVRLSWEGTLEPRYYEAVDDEPSYSVVVDGAGQRAERGELVIEPALECADGCTGLIDVIVFGGGSVRIEPVDRSASVRVIDQPELTTSAQPLEANGVVGEPIVLTMEVPEVVAAFGNTVAISLDAELGDPALDCRFQASVTVPASERTWSRTLPAPESARDLVLNRAVDAVMIELEEIQPVTDPRCAADSGEAIRINGTLSVPGLAVAPTDRR